jgi:arylsulfatase A-like enzyme
MLTPAPIAIDAQRQSITPFFEYDPALKDGNALYHNHGGFLSEETLISAARRAGLSTAAIGKLGPTALQHIEGLDGTGTIIVDDATGGAEPMNDGRAQGIALTDDIAAAIAAQTGDERAPGRRQNGFTGGCETPGTMAPNLLQQTWFTDVATNVILPRFKAAGKPFFLVFWSRDPDGTQHNQGDSAGRLVPGINGPSSRAAIRNADESLRRLRAAVRKLGLEDSTDIIVAADHGFSTIAKESKTSGSAVLPCGEVDHALPPGFLAMDIARHLDMKAADPDTGGSVIQPIPGSFSRRGNAVIGNDSAKPDVVIAANGGSDLLYLPSPARKALAPRIVQFLLTQDYVSGIFIDDALGKIPGTLPFSAINLIGGAHTIRPAMIINFRSFATGCDNPLLCAAEVADTTLVQGQGMHGAFSRADTFNFMAAIGPSFKAGYVNRAPASNADIGTTIAHLLGLKPKTQGTLNGRILTETMAGGEETRFSRRTIQGPPANGLATTVVLQEADGRRYLEAGGFPGRTVGLEAAP